MKIIKQRAPKFKRKPDEIGGVKLQERDIRIMRLAHDYRFLNSDQIRALIDGSHQGISRRLKKLFHHGLLDRPPSQIVYPLAGTQKMVYALADKGADLLAEKFGIDRGKIKWNEKNREVRDRHIQHTLMVSGFRVCLELALGRVPNTHLLFWENENRKELKDHVYIEDQQGREWKIAIVPDGFFGIQDPKGKMYFFLEADQSTMVNARFLRKMRAYWHWWKQGRHTKKFSIKAFRVLTITKTEQRKENLRKITKAADERQRGSLMFWFTSEQNYSIQKPESILPIWQTPVDDSFHSLLE
ncbi:hypothetical protein ES702_01111 [subsurface metagenome]